MNRIVNAKITNDLSCSSLLLLLLQGGGAGLLVLGAQKTPDQMYFHKCGLGLPLFKGGSMSYRCPWLVILFLKVRDVYVNVEAQHMRHILCAVIADLSSALCLSEIVSLEFVLHRRDQSLVRWHHNLVFHRPTHLKKRRNVNFLACLPTLCHRGFLLALDSCEPFDACVGWQRHGFGLFGEENCRRVLLFPKVNEHIFNKINSVNKAMQICQSSEKKQTFNPHSSWKCRASSNLEDDDTSIISMPSGISCNSKWPYSTRQWKNQILCYFQKFEMAKGPLPHQNNLIKFAEQIITHSRATYAWELPNWSESLEVHNNDCIIKNFKYKRKAIKAAYILQIQAKPQAVKYRNPNHYYAIMMPGVIAY